MTEYIVSLNIIMHVDDYKPSGESSTVNITLHKTYASALNYLKEFMKTDFILRKNEYKVAYTRDYIEKTKYNHLFVLVNGKYEFDESVEINEEDIEYLHDMFCEGEFTPYRWTYSIKTHKNPYNQ